MSLLVSGLHGISELRVPTTLRLRRRDCHSLHMQEKPSLLKRAEDYPIPFAPPTQAAAWRKRPQLPPQLSVYHPYSGVCSLADLTPLRYSRIFFFSPYVCSFRNVRERTDDLRQTLSLLLDTVLRTDAHPLTYHVPVTRHGRAPIPLV